MLDSPLLPLSFQPKKYGLGDRLRSGLLPTTSLGVKQSAWVCVRKCQSACYGVVDVARTCVPVVRARISGSQTCIWDSWLFMTSNAAKDKARISNRHTEC